MQRSDDWKCVCDRRLGYYNRPKRNRIQWLCKILCGKQVAFISGLCGNGELPLLMTQFESRDYKVQHWTFTNPLPEIFPLSPLEATEYLHKQTLLRCDLRLWLAILRLLAWDWDGVASNCTVVLFWWNNFSPVPAQFVIANDRRESLSKTVPRCNSTQLRPKLSLNIQDCSVHPSFIPEVLSTLVSFFLTAYLRIFKDSFSSMDGGHTFEWVNF